MIQTDPSRSWTSIFMYYRSVELIYSMVSGLFPTLPRRWAVRTFAPIRGEISRRPARRTGARGAIMSIYCRDPDGNLVEFSFDQGVYEEHEVEENEREDALRAKIEEIDPDALTPREALALLYELKDL